QNVDSDVRFAVRSSACDEDGTEASAAGQNLTVLGCTGLDQLLDALTQCWASVLTFSSVQYRRQRGIAPVGEMAVIIQEMVAADVAGVVFTRDPATGSPTSVTITANYGLGESVVSGSSEPDTVVVRRSWRGLLSMTSSTTGDKAMRHVMCASGGVREEEVPDRERRRCCISEALSLRLARLALYIEQVFASPRDIEFAVVKDQIYLLQARPITSLESWSELELQLELDDAILSDEELLTCANTGEVLPGALAPLTNSLVPRILDISLQYVMSQRSVGGGYRVDPAGGKCIISTYLHCMLNMMEILYRTVDTEISTVTQSLDLAVFGHLVTSKDYHRRALQRYGPTSTIRQLYVALFSFWEYLYNKWRVPALQEQTRHYNIKTGRAVKPHVLFAQIASRVPELIHISETHARSSSASSFTQLLALTLLTENRKTISSENIADIATMLRSCCNEEDSTAVPAALTCLTEEISKDEERDEFLGLPLEEGRVWLQSHPGRVGDIFQEFIEQHGHRCFREVCPYCARHRRTVVRRALSFVLPMCREAVNKREATKSCLIKAIDAFRRAFRNLGDLLVAEGRIPTAELVFYLQFYELSLLVQYSAPYLVAKAVRRKRMVPRLDKLRFPEISEGRPVP
ncbi:Pyruvate phosphate dikinase PEP/pyruvate-binding, partial [Trinorchestia longiramus]